MTFENTYRSLPGTVALIGSGEYLPTMNEVDTYLLKTVAGVHTAHVALIPTASGLELMGPKFWNDLGLNHFRQLGVSDVRTPRLLDYESANDPAQVALLEGCNLFYFSGGNPLYAIDVLYDTLAWQSIQAAYEHGAALAGCSAGAMMLGGCTLSSIRQAMMGNSSALVAALGIIPHLIVLPHFDRMPSFLHQKRFQQMFQTVPPGYIIVGIDEETALIRVELDVKGSGQDRWRVMGRQTVTVFVGDRPEYVLKSGDEILL